MDELLVVLGALVALVLSIAGMNIYRWRTDVLTGPYFSNRDPERTIPDSRTDRVDRATAQRSARRPLSGMLLALNEPRKSTRYSTNRARKATMHAEGSKA